MEFVWMTWYYVNNVMNRELSNILLLFQSADSTLAGNQTMYYRPLSRLTFMIDYKLFGLNPVWYHLENITIHIFAVLLLFLLMERLLMNRAGFVTSCVFAVHPVNAEAVNFLSTRNTLLSAVFCPFFIYRLYASGDYRKKSLFLSLCRAFFPWATVQRDAFMLIVILLFLRRNFTPRYTTRVKGKVSELWPFAIAVTYILAYGHTLFRISLYEPCRRDIASTGAQQCYIIPNIWWRYCSGESKCTLLCPGPLRYAVDLYPFRMDYHLCLSWSFFWRCSCRHKIRAVLGSRSIFVPISNIIAIPSAPMADRYMYLPASAYGLLRQICFAFSMRGERTGKPWCPAGWLSWSVLLR